MNELEKLWYVLELPLKLVVLGTLLTFVAFAPLMSIDGMNLIQWIFSRN